MIRFSNLFQALPIVAILRGITPEEVEAICAVLFEENIRLIEIPLNSPEPFNSIKIISEKMADKIFIGAGTVTNIKDAEQVIEAGGQYLVAPNCDAEVIDWAVQNDIEILPGVFTPTEAFEATKYGARYLKCFPAGSMDKSYFKHLKTVLSDSTKLLAVGGVTPLQMKEYLGLGIDGFGVGSDLFKPGDTPEIVRTKARALVNGLQKN